jgi:hypothetical protein
MVYVNKHVAPVGSPAPGPRMARTQRGVRASRMLTYSDAKFDKDR